MVRRNWGRGRAPARAHQVERLRNCRIRLRNCPIRLNLSSPLFPAPEFPELIGCATRFQTKSYQGRVVLAEVAEGQSTREGASVQACGILASAGRAAENGVGAEHPRGRITVAAWASAVQTELLD